VQCVQLQPRGAGAQVARHMHDPNSIIDARSVSPGKSCPDHVFLCPPILLIKNSVWARRGPNRRVPRRASSPSHCNHTYTLRSNIFVLDRIVFRFGTEGLAKTAFPMNIAILYGKSRSERLLRISRVSCITLGILWFSEVGCIPI